MVGNVPVGDVPVGDVPQPCSAVPGLRWPGAAAPSGLNAAGARSEVGFPKGTFDATWIAARHELEYCAMNVSNSVSWTGANGLPDGRPVS